jgi:hypothetical protein
MRRPMLLRQRRLVEYELPNENGEDHNRDNDAKRKKNKLAVQNFLPRPCRPHEA